MSTPFPSLPASHSTSDLSQAITPRKPRAAQVPSAGTTPTGPGATPASSSSSSSSRHASPSATSSPVLTRSPSIPQNYHPYLIHTTSSSLLTRSNSSPSQPLAELARHKPARSLSSLAHSVSESELCRAANASPEEEEAASTLEDKEGSRRKSMESPVGRPGMRRSGTLPVMARMQAWESPTTDEPKEIVLPLNPKDWSPSELARYLVHTLRTGGQDGNDQTLPMPLVKDIESWILRGQVTGRMFLKGNQDSWTSSRPPPFLPLLLSISRRLRRRSLQSRLSNDPVLPTSPLVEHHARNASVLFEEEEDDADSPSFSDTERPARGVRQIARDIDAAAVLSDASEEPEPLRPQWTGGSGTGEVWRRWEERERAAVGAASPVVAAAPRRRRRESELSFGSLADGEGSPAPRIRGFSEVSSPAAAWVRRQCQGQVTTAANVRQGDPENSAAMSPENRAKSEDKEFDTGPGGTVKAPPPNLALGLGIQMPSHSAGDGSGEAREVKEASPPPPYQSPDLDSDESDAQSRQQNELLPPAPDADSVTPRKAPLARVGLSPGQERLDADKRRLGNGVPSSPEEPGPATTIVKRKSYSSLRRQPASPRDSKHGSQKDSLRLRSMRSKPPYAAAQAGESECDTGRKATVRPNRIESLFIPPHAPGDGTKSPREIEMEGQLSDLMTRIKELEGRLEHVEAERNALSRPASPATGVRGIDKSILVRLGLLPEEDGMPRRIRELPGYLFLVGVGVGAVVVRVLMMSGSSSKSVFFLGATGYIGGMVFSKILGTPTPPSLVTVLVRNAQKAPLFEQLDLPQGTTLKVLQGALEEHDKLSSAAAEHDIVVNTADADDLPAVKALLAGMKARKDKTGHRSLYIHTSGTGVMVDDAKGEYPNDIIYTDLHPAPASRTSPALLSMEEIPRSAPHREVDITINEADARGELKAYIVLPSTIWGAGKGVIYQKGISNSFSDQMPTMMKIGLDRKRAGMVGKGANIWPHVELADLGDLYALIYQRSQKGDIGHGKSGFYLGISGEYTYLAAAQAIGQSLVENKWADDAQPTTLSGDEMQKYFSGSWFFGTNSRGKADRSKSIGWRPKYTDERDFLRYVREELVRVEKTFGREMKEATGNVY